MGNCGRKRYQKSLETKIFVLCCESMLQKAYSLPNSSSFRATIEIIRYPYRYRFFLVYKRENIVSYTAVCATVCDNYCISVMTAF